MKTERPRHARDRSALDICEESFNLLRAAPWRVLACYAAGTVPFLLGLMYFWADMSRSAFAARHLAPGSLGLAILFVWMKCWQAVFAAELRAFAVRAAPPAWTVFRVIRLVGAQASIQPYGLVLIPLAALAVFPFYAVYSFFQNVTALGAGEGDRVRELLRRSWRHGLLWPLQNHILIWLLSPWLLSFGMMMAVGAMWIAQAVAPDLPAVYGAAAFWLASVVLYYLILPLAPFGAVVAGNIAAVLLILPALLSALTGSENVFTLSGAGGFMNTTFLMTVFSLSYLFLDPLAKTAYILRCLYGDSLQTGEDLRGELRQIQAARRTAEENG